MDPSSLYAETIVINNENMQAAKLNIYGSAVDFTP